MPDEMGSIDVVETLEIGGDRVTVFRQEDETTRTATLVLRGATQNHLDDVERAVDDGVNVVKAITRDPRLVPGAGATEVELVERIQAHGEKTPGLSQYAIKKYGEAFEVVPRTIAESAGLDATEVLSRLYAAHANSEEWDIGVDIEVGLDLVKLIHCRHVSNTEYRTTITLAPLMPRMRASSISSSPSNGLSSLPPRLPAQSCPLTRSSWHDKLVGQSPQDLTLYVTLTTVTADFD
jgi:hypothetical protein